MIRCCSILLAAAATTATSSPTAASPPPAPTLVFGTTIQIAEAYANSPGSGPQRDGCLAAAKRLVIEPTISDIVFDGAKGRLRQSNAHLVHNPTANLTSIGRWDLPAPREWDLQSDGGGQATCFTELLPNSTCPNGTKVCPPKFGGWGQLNPFTSILGMWYPNTSLVEEETTPTYDVYRFVYVDVELIPNDGCGTSSCTMDHCSTCNVDAGHPCTKCPCPKCVQRLPITRNYTYHVAKKREEDGTRGLLRYSWTQGIPLTKDGGPGFGRDCFIFDWSKQWISEVDDSDFSLPSGLKCTPRTVEAE